MNGWMLNMSHIAVIMSVYSNDRPEWFIEAVESVVNQTYRNGDIRIYLGIDGNIPEPIQNYIDNHDFFYKTLTNSTNIGLAGTLNRLIDVLEDEKFVARMDADDICRQDRFDKEMRFMIDNPDTDVVGSWCEEIDENGRVLFIKRQHQDDATIKKKLMSKNPFIHPSVLLRRRVFDNGYRYCQDNFLAEDYTLWLNLAAHGYKFANIPENLIKFRIDNGFFQRRRGYKRAVADVKMRLRAMDIMKNRSTKNYLIALLYGMMRFLPPNLLRYVYFRFR